jgi:hypothetical protein
VIFIFWFSFVHLCERYKRLLSYVLWLLQNYTSNAKSWQAVHGTTRLL